MVKGTALQAIKFSTMLNNGMAERFLRDWLADIDLSLWRVQIQPVVDTSTIVPPSVTFQKFCEMNPDEPERGDGRKVHYGLGRQPLDDIKDAGWGPEFAASNVLKYLRRNKDTGDSKKKAQWYWRDLNEMCQDDDNHPKNVRRQLEKMLTYMEMKTLKEKT